MTHIGGGLAAAAIVAALCVGCASRTARVDTENDAEITVSYDWRDLDGAAAAMARSLLASPRLAAVATEARPAVVALGPVVNDTCQHLDPALLTERLGEALLASGRFEVSALFGGAGTDRATVSAARTVRGNAEFDAATIQRKGQLKAPDLAVTGKLTQRNVRRDNGGTRIEYFLTLKATRLADGVALWQDSRQTVKAVAKGMPTW